MLCKFILTLFVSISVITLVESTILCKNTNQHFFKYNINQTDLNFDELAVIAVTFIKDKNDQFIFSHNDEKIPNLPDLIHCNRTLISDHFQCFNDTDSLGNFRDRFFYNMENQKVGIDMEKINEPVSLATKLFYIFLCFLLLEAIPITLLLFATPNPDFSPKTKKTTHPLVPLIPKQISATVYGDYFNTLESEQTINSAIECCLKHNLIGSLSKLESRWNQLFPTQKLFEKNEILDKIFKSLIRRRAFASIQWLLSHNQQELIIESFNKQCFETDFVIYLMVRKDSDMLQVVLPLVPSSSYSNKILINNVNHTYLSFYLTKHDFSSASTNSWCVVLLKMILDHGNYKFENQCSLVLALTQLGLKNLNNDIRVLLYSCLHNKNKNLTDCTF